MCCLRSVLLYHKAQFTLPLRNAFALASKKLAFEPVKLLLEHSHLISQGFDFGLGLLQFAHYPIYIISMLGMRPDASIG